MKHVALVPIRVYRLLVSPWLPAACRFTPSCSEYAEEAIRRFGVFRGTLLAAKRLVQCHPWGSHGYDPVPLAGAASGKGRRGR